MSYISVTDTAKLVRKALKGAFPGTKFSVRSEKYAGGASIHVGWTDGPTTREVDKVVGVFAGADFDGMVDLKVYAEHWLHPDGTVTLARRPGTNGSFAELIGDPIGPEAQLVRFGADFVQTQRRISDEWKEEILAEFAELLDRDVSVNDLVPLHVTREGELLRMVDSETEYANTLVWRYTGERERTQVR